MVCKRLSFLLVLAKAAWGRGLQGADCTGAAVQRCAAVPACQAVGSLGASCEVGYASCLRSSGCPADMYASMLRASVEGSLFVLQADDTNGSCRGLGRPPRSHLIPRGSFTAAFVEDALAAEVPSWSTRAGAGDSARIGHWAAGSGVSRQPVIVVGDSSVIVAWGPGVQYSLALAAAAWPGEDCAAATEAALYGTVSAAAGTPLSVDFVAYRGLRRALAVRVCPHDDALDGAPVAGLGPASSVAGGASVGGADVAVVSLARRSDRWRGFVRRAAASGLVEGRHFSRFDAVDGRGMRGDDPDLRKRFAPLPGGPEGPGGWDGLLTEGRAGVVGCGLSHVALWARAAAGGKLFVVLEDDATILPGLRGLEEVVAGLAARGFDGVAFLGYHRRGGLSAEDEYFDLSSGDPSGESVVAVSPLAKGHFLGGTFGYVLSPGQASRFLATLDAAPFEQANGTFAVDHFMRTHAEFHAAAPRIVHAHFLYTADASISDAGDSDVAGARLSGPR